jgi:hypothetical protein
MRQVMPARRPQLAELGLFLLVVALPLVFTPFSASPFGDPKLVVLTGGCLCLVASGLSADRLTAYAGAALVTVTLLAACVGVDPLKGLTAQTTSRGNGLITVTCLAVLAAIGAALPEELRRRTMRWLVAAGVAVAVVGLVYRLVPGAADALFPGGGLRGSTLGNPVFAIAFVSAALGAHVATGWPASSRWSWVVVAVMGLGAASFGQRSAFVFPVVACAAAWWRLPRSRHRVGRAMLVVVAMLLVWQVVDPLLPSPGRLQPQLTSLTSERARLVMVTVGARSTADRPLLGWGPGSVQSAHIANASVADLEATGRGVADAHNILATSMIELGLVGLAAMLGLLGLLVRRAVPRAADGAPAFAAAAALGLYSLLEPISLALTPLLFLFLAMSGPVSTDLLGARRSSRAAHLVARTVVVVSLGAAMAVSVQMLTAATLERWGRTYGEIWALEDALRVQPWRVTAAQRLALRLAIDGRSGDIGAAERARQVIGEAVADHPWEVDVRLTAADVETLLRDDAAAEAWVAEHLERFPADEEGVRRTAREASKNTLPGA